MKKITAIFRSILFALITLSGFAQNNSGVVKSKNTNKQIEHEFSLCEAENGHCAQKCMVILTNGKKINLGSYIKVKTGKEIITEGYILKHISGAIFILRSKKDAENKNIKGGCADDIYSIDIKKSQVWGC